MNSWSIYTLWIKETNHSNWIKNKIQWKYLLTLCLSTFIFVSFQGNKNETESWAKYSMYDVSNIFDAAQATASKNRIKCNGSIFTTILNGYFDYVLMQCRIWNQAVMKRITIFKNGTPAEGRVSNYKLYIAFHIMFLFNFHHRGLLLFTLFIFVPFHRPSIRFKAKNPLVCLASCWQIRMHNKLNIPHFTLQILQ